MTTKLNVYEVHVTYTQSIRLVIRAESPEAATERVAAGDWTYRNEIDSEASGFTVCDVKRAAKARRQP